MKKKITTMGAVFADEKEEIIFDNDSKPIYELSDFCDTACVNIYSDPNYDDSSSEEDPAGKGFEERSIADGELVAEIGLIAIRGEAIAMMEQNPWECYDAISDDLVYVAAALREENISLSENIVYIEGVNLTDGNDDILLRARIIKELPRICMARFGFVPYLLAYIEEENNPADSAAFRAEQFIRVGKGRVLVRFSDHLPQLEPNMNMNHSFNLS